MGGRTVTQIIEARMGDVEADADAILADIRAERPKAKTTRRSVSSALAKLRKRYGVDRVPIRPGAGAGSKGYGLRAWLASMIDDVESNVELAKLASEHFNRIVTSATVGSYRWSIRNRPPPRTRD